MKESEREKKRAVVFCLSRARKKKIERGSSNDEKEREKEKKKNHFFRFFFLCIFFHSVCSLFSLLLDLVSLSFFRSSRARESRSECLSGAKKEERLEVEKTSAKEEKKRERGIEKNNKTATRSIARETSFFLLFLSLPFVPVPFFSLSLFFDLSSMAAAAAADMEAEIFGDGGAGGGAGGGAENESDLLPPEFATMSADDIGRRARLLDNEVRVLRDEATRLNLEQANLTEKVRMK